MKHKKALVTGGAGFIGSHIVERLIKIGINTIILDNLSVGRKENIPSEAELITGDICDPKIVNKSLSEVDIVFHLAAQVSIRNSFNKFIEDTRTNVMGTVNLLECIKGSEVKKFIYASSMAVYGDNKYLPIDEKHPLEPTSPYGISKLASEKYILCFCEHCGIDIVILRYFNTYGPKQTFTPYVGVITIFIQKLLRDEFLPIFGDGKQVRDFISVYDVADANLLALGYSGPFKIFNIGSGIGININNLAQILKKIMKKQNKLEYLSKQSGEPTDSIADITLAKNELGFSPHSHLEEKLQEVIEWNTAKTH